MKKEIADKWVKALRSGKYKQGKGYLNYDGKFCCLGVLCELAAEKRIVTKISMIDKTTYYRDLYDESRFVLPTAVKIWAEMRNHKGRYSTNLPDLTDLNDSCKSFEYIANLIEENYKDL